MIINGFNLKKWTYKGYKLSQMHRIIIRFLVFPFYYLFRLMLCLCIFAGWGFDEAARMWSNTE